MILFKYRISDKNDIDESINIDELIVKSHNPLKNVWTISNNLKGISFDRLSPVSVFN